jgi:hypothetical protein
MDQILDERKYTLAVTFQNLPPPRTDITTGPQHTGCTAHLHKIEAWAIERNNSSMGSPVSMDDQPARILYRSQMPSDRRAGSWSARRFDLIYRDGRWGHKNGGHDHRVKKNSSAARLVSCRSFHNSDAPGHVEMRRTRTTRQGDWSIGSQPTTNS